MSDHPVAHTPGQVAHETHHEPQGFLRKYVFSTNHKVIGIQFLFSGLLWMLIGGLLAMLVRHKLAWPEGHIPVLGDALFKGNQGVMDDASYNMFFTMHASVMIFLVIIPTLVGAFGNYLIPLQIGARDMAFPTLNMISYWMMWPAYACFIASFLVEGGAATGGWTAYPPISVLEGQGQLGQTLWAAGVICVGWSSVMGAINYITTIIKLRAPGMTFFRMPLAVWSLFVTAILTLLATPVLASAMICLILERVVGTSFFMTANVFVGGTELAHSGGMPLLWQHMFWFYSHPAVYIMILPAMGMVSDIISTFARKPLFGYRPMVYSLCAIAGLGFVVWGHHMFQSGMNPYLGMTFMISTTMIALPSAVKVFNWLGTLWGGQIRFTAAMLNAVAFVGMFIIGGLSGVFMASTPVDVQLHDTYFIVAHLHYVLFGGSMFGIFAGIYMWYPKMFGRCMNERLGRWHFGGTFIFFNITFFTMHYIGLMGMQRRIGVPSNFELLKPLQPWQILMTVSAFCLFLFQILFIINFFRSFKHGEKAGDNPWESNSLEWACSSPPWHENFEVIPTVYRGPYEYASPEVEEDYLPQSRDTKQEPAS
ncbi:MAG: cbb3-type cytochrome c oxidase subunit I [Planctomycetota bacterium]|nr:cbb3-type cytochrome c oxidase subunit I [Planctomycetota bacterium]